MYTYDTVTGAINGLKERGYTRDFNVAFDKLICTNEGTRLDPADFEITEVYRFEGETNPADEDIVYAVEALEGKMKGVISMAYGMYADPVSEQMIKKLSLHRQIP